MQLESAAAQPRQLTLTLDDVKALPRVEMVTELKCIEGWSDPVHWSGVRLVDFADKYGVATKSGGKASAPTHADDLFQYVSMETPDRGYYVGLDIESALHPQTLLCYEMNGQPLTAGAWRTAAAGDAAQIRHQAHQADREDRVYRPAAGRLLG